MILKGQFVKFVIVFVLFGLVGSALGGDFVLTILHTNDVHARVTEAYTVDGSTCYPKMKEAKKCVGGFPRLLHMVNQLKETHQNVLFLNAGDYYQGTPWYSLFKWKGIAKFLDQLNYTAITFGNHEFDDGVNGVVPYLDAINTPVLCANLDDSKAPEIQGKYAKSLVVEVAGRKIGLIGYNTQDSNSTSHPAPASFTDAKEAVTKEAARLYEKEGVKILIALGHGGYEALDPIMATVPYIDVVIGGHSHTFLYTGTSPDPIDVPSGPYPTVGTRPDGKKVPIVQAYWFGKYLGYLNLTIDDNGEVTGWAGQPILLDHTVPEDPALLAEISVMQKQIDDVTGKYIGKSLVMLNGDFRYCRLEECNLSNLFGDAMIYSFLKQETDEKWKKVRMAIVTSGFCRESVDTTWTEGNVTSGMLINVMPFGNKIIVFEIKGKYLRQAFEYGVDNYRIDRKMAYSKFLQVSGIRVVYDVTKPPGSRVKSLYVYCDNCTQPSNVPSLVPIEDEKVYLVAAPDYVTQGGDGHVIIKNNIISQVNRNIKDIDAIGDFIASRTPVTQANEGRISFENSGSNSNSSTSSNDDDGPSPNHDLELKLRREELEFKKQMFKAQQEERRQDRELELKKLELQEQIRAEQYSVIIELLKTLTGTGRGTGLPSNGSTGQGQGSSADSSEEKDSGRGHGHGHGHGHKEHLGRGDGSYTSSQLL